MNNKKLEKCIDEISQITGHYPYDYVLHENYGNFDKFCEAGVRYGAKYMELAKAKIISRAKAQKQETA